MTIIRKALSLLLVLLQLTFTSVSYGKGEAPVPEPTESPALIHNIDGDTAMAATIRYAAACANTVQAVFTDGSRSACRLSNTTAQLTHQLTGLSKRTATLCDANGNVYVADSFDPYYTDTNGKTYSAAASRADGRVNTIRLGEYYYESHVRDLDFLRIGSDPVFKVDKAYHIYADRLYEQLTLVAAKPTTALHTFGTKIQIPVRTVNAIQVRDANGIHSTTDGLDPTTVEYAAFDIRGVGVFAVIIPSDGSTASVTVTKKGANYIIDQTASYIPGTGINQYDESGGYALNNVTFGRRLYTDSTHTFDVVEREAQLERHPLETITVSPGNANAAYLGYDALRGAYTLSLRGAYFTTAYTNPDLQFKAPIRITNSGAPRDIVIRAFGDSGCLEAAALLDDTGALVPVDVQVSKNFCGDIGEYFYGIKDYEYGDSFFPIRLGAEETLSFTLLNLYQNWGRYPLKQLSSIEYFRSYYHLSTGVTESNCIAPYSASDHKDGWLLPDFRGRSGTMWAEQPQFNSVGELKFVSMQKRILGLINADPDYGEYTGCTVSSVGQAYSDITNNYTADCGAYSYSLRHVEFPQTDENRTFYQINVTFNTDMTFKNCKRDLTLFYMNGRFVTYNKCGYLDQNNTLVTMDTAAVDKTVYHTLGTECPYFGFYSVTPETEHYIDEYFGSNCAVLVRSSKFVQNGKEVTLPLAIREQSSKDVSSAVLTLDAKRISFKKGDTISLDVILLPWGTGRETDDAGVRAIRFDSALHPTQAASDTCEILNDAVVPTVKSVNNAASFTLTGGKNNVAVKVTGFTKLTRPHVLMECDGETQSLALPSSNGYDGYSVQYAADGTYTYSFICPIEDPTAQYHLTVTV